MFDDRLKKLRQEKDLNMKQMSRLLGIPYTTYIGYEKNEREPNSEMLGMLADFFNCSVDYLLGRDANVSDKTNEIDDDLLKQHGNIYYEKKTQPQRSIESNIQLLNQNKVYNIPIFESVSAGFGANASDYIVGYMPIYIENPADVKNMLCIKVKGDSMYPKIEDGDTVVVRKQSSVDSGSIAVVLIDNEEELVKKVVYDEEHIELISINPEYAPKRFEGKDVLRVSVVGLVKQIIKEV